MTLTAGFDAVVQLRADVLERILGAQHRAGALRHHVVRRHGDRQVELLVNRPLLRPLTGIAEDGRVRVRLPTRVHYHHRALEHPADEGVSAIADVAVRAAIGLSTGNPGALGDDVLLGVDWLETTRGDIQVTGVERAVAEDVRDAVLDALREDAGGRYRLPPIGSPERRVGSLGLCFLPGTNDAALLAVGLNLGDAVRGDPAALQSAFAVDEWALALAPALVLGELRASLRAQLGGRLPPPAGAAPVLLADEVVCAFPGPFGTCLDRARRRTFLDALTVALEPDAVAVRGSLRVTTDAFYVPDLSARFGITVSLSLGSDRRVRAVAGPVEVDVAGIGDVLDALTGGAIEATIRAGVEAALQPSTIGGATDLFSADVVSRFAALGTSGTLRVEPVATAVEVRPDGVVLHGQVAVHDASAPPEPALAVLRPAGSLTRRLMHAGGSWAPGATVTRYGWEFGDGHSVSGENRVVTVHDFAPGAYDVCLDVTDDAGRTRRTCRRLETARLTVRHTPHRHDGAALLEWQACQTADPIHVELTVLDEHTPVADALVRIEGREYLLEGRTDKRGVVTFEVDITGDHARSDGSGSGFMIVRVSKAGYLPAAFERLRFIDCAALSEVVDRGRLRIAELADRYAALLEQLGPQGRLPGDPTDPFGRPQRDPRTEPATEIGLALDVLTGLLLLAERNSTVLPYPALLGIDDRERPLDEFLRRIESSAANVTKAIDQAVGPSARPPG